ncbi:MAG: hypothetical protein IIC13_19455 [SAR324 cluster bacterium]|nr:hypothetical protein [SAR324 cluster bacterium]
MASSDRKRKSTTILCADVVGYSRLMEENEEETLDALESSHDIFSKVIQNGHGRVVNSPGDSLLAEFSSAVVAVNSAVTIQREIEQKNSGLDASRKMKFRIGINLGDVIEKKDGQLYGDGVNRAARLEPLANPGGICISGIVYELVKGKLDLSLEFVNEVKVKNISNPIMVYRVVMQGESKADDKISDKKAKEITTSVLKSLDSFSFLDALTWGQVNYLIKEETVDVKVIVLSRLKSQDVARIMVMMPEKVQLELAVQFGALQALAPEKFMEVAINLAEKAKKVPDAEKLKLKDPAALLDNFLEGTAKLPETIGQTSPETREGLLADMKSQYAKPSKAVENHFFRFDYISLLHVNELSEAFRTLPWATVVAALHGASDEIQRKVITVFSDKSRSSLALAMRRSRADKKTINEARRRVVAKFQRLSQMGRVNLKNFQES